MLIKQITLYNFRGLENQTIEFSKRISIVCGKNGQGKTSLLEAIYLLSQAKSFRSSKLKELLSWAAADGVLEVSGLIETILGSKKIKYQLVKNKKKILINDKNIINANEFYGQFQALEFTPNDTRLVSEGSLVRRQFIDRLIAMIDNSFVSESLNYNLALKNRNALILESLKNKWKAGDLVKLTAIWDMALIENGLKISQKRQNFIQQFQVLFANVYSLLVGKTAELVVIKYQGKFFNNSNSQLQSVAELSKKYNECLAQDQKYQTTIFGVHRDKLDIFIKCGNGDFQLTKVAASQGQKKSIALALKISAMHFLQEQNSDGELPVLLLDDVESELDSIRKQALYEIILNTKNQIFISTTEKYDWLNNILAEAEVIRIEEGKSCLYNNDC
ncbi:MAG: DNA replication and repair protein RecF [Deltaproteobacteria bacterium]|jgi:DNA replication and repair protein RecF|nr:DNA replication and repair protein RecF [Deltaproteobacteria bacterium]